MAPKRPAKERPPSKHSSASSSSSDDDAGEDAFLSPPPNPKPIASKPSKQPRAPSRTSSSVSGTDDDKYHASSNDDDKDHASSTDDDNHTTVSIKPPNPTAGSPPPATSRKLLTQSVKPISSKPIGAGASSSGKQKKPSASVPPAKRPAEDSNAGSDDEEPTAKKQLIQRLWTDDDEVVVLKGMLEYKKKAKDPVADMPGFLKLVQKSLSFDCQQPQLVTKLRGLKKKFETSMKRLDMGKNPTSGKPRDQIVFELGRKIWGGSSSKPEEAASHDNGEETVRKDGKKTKVSTLSDGKASNRVKNDGKVSQRVDSLDVAAAAVGNGEGGGWEHPSWVMKDLCLSGTVICEEMVKKGASLMDAEEVEEYDNKWKELKMMEMEIAVKRSELVRRHIQAIMKALMG